MADGPTAWARATARSLLGRSYTLSKQVALARMARHREPPTVVFSMGKTGSTAVARAVQDATGRPVFQVFRLDAARLGPAEQRYRTRAAATADGTHRDGAVPFPGAYHLWESEHLIRHPPTPSAPWTVITTVREPVAQAVSAFFHAVRRSDPRTSGTPTSVESRSRAPERLSAPTGLTELPQLTALTQRFVSENWVQAPLRWFAREFTGAVGFDALGHPFDPGTGWGIVETPAVRLLILRQESFDAAPDALASFLGFPAAVDVPRRNDGARGRFADVYRRFLDQAHLPQELLDQAYGSDFAQHFYGPEEIEAFRRRWSSA
jgi:hypothetical protein